MRILFLVHGFPPEALGGTELYAHDLAQALSHHCGDEVTIIARESNPSLPEYEVRETEVGGLPVHLINNTFDSCRTYRETYLNPQVRYTVSRLIEQARPEVVHIHHLSGLCIGLIDEIRSRSIPSLFTLQDYWLSCHRGQLFDRNFRRCAGPFEEICEQCIGFDEAVGRGSFHRTAKRLEKLPAFPGRGAIRRWFVRRAQRSRPEAQKEAMTTRLQDMRDMAKHVDLFLAPSKTMQDRARRFGIPEDRLTYRTQGIVHSRFHGLERREDPRLRVGFMGSLIHSKAPHLVIQAFDSIPSDQAVLRVFGEVGHYHGDAQYRDEILPLLEQPSVDHVGPVPHAEVPRRVFGEIDVLVIPSIWIENAPFVIRESFLAGVPVLASDLGGMAEMVRHGQDGLLFEPGNPIEIRNCLRRLLDEPGLLDRLRAGIAPVKTIEEDAESTRSDYSRLLSRRGSGFGSLRSRSN